MIAVIMITVMITMIGLLIAAPNAQLQQVAEATAKERSARNADAGIRDAVVFLMVNKSNLTTWVDTNKTIIVSTTPGVAVASCVPTTTPTQTQATGLSPDPSTSGYLCLSYTAGSLDLAFSAFFAGPSLNSPLSTLDVDLGQDVSKFPVFAKNNYKPAGDARTFASDGTPLNAYAYAILDCGNGYYRVLVEGRATAGWVGQNVQTGQIATPRTLTTRIDAFLYNPINIVTNPGAVTFANPTGGAILNATTGTSAGWTNPDPATFTDAAANPPSQPMVYTSTTGGGSDKVSNTPANFVSGIDQATSNPTNTAGVQIQNNNLYFDNSTGVAAGSPAVDQNATVADQTASASVFTSVTNVVDAISSLPAGTSGVTNYTYTAGTTISVGNTTPTVTYIKIPDNTTVNSTLLNFNGSATYSGVIIVDVGNNVKFNFALGSVSLFNFNGNPNQELGAFIFYQRGSITVPSTGVYLSDNKGNATSKLDWNSYDYKTALTNVNVPLKICAYRIVQ